MADVLERQKGPPSARVRREGGSSGSGVETAEKSTSGSRLDAREMEERRCRCGFGCRCGFAFKL